MFGLSKIEEFLHILLLSCRETCHSNLHEMAMKCKYWSLNKLFCLSFDVILSENWFCGPDKKCRHELSRWVKSLFLSARRRMTRHDERVKIVLTCQHRKTTPSSTRLFVISPARSTPLNFCSFLWFINIFLPSRSGRLVVKCLNLESFS